MQNLGSYNFMNCKNCAAQGREMCGLRLIGIDIILQMFQDPKITIDIKEDKGGGNLITCATNETIGEANMTLYNLNLNGRMLTTKRLHQSTRPPILYVKNTIPMDEVGMFICDVTDDLGKYRAKLNWRSDGTYTHHMIMFIM